MPHRGQARARNPTAQIRDGRCNAAATPRHTNLPPPHPESRNPSVLTPLEHTFNQNLTPPSLDPTRPRPARALRQSHDRYQKLDIRHDVTLVLTQSGPYWIGGQLRN